MTSVHQKSVFLSKCLPEEGLKRFLEIYKAQWYKLDYPNHDHNLVSMAAKLPNYQSASLLCKNALYE